MTNHKSQRISFARNNTSGVVDVSGGTLLIVLAQNLSKDYQYKSWLVAAAPAVTTFLVFLWKSITMKYSLFKNKRDTRKKKMELRQEVDEFMNHPFISSQGKESIRKQWEKTQLALVQERIRELNELRGLHD